MWNKIKNWYKAEMVKEIKAHPLFAEIDNKVKELEAKVLELESTLTNWRIHALSLEEQLKVKL